MTYSMAIDHAVALAESEGNVVVEISTGWTKVREVVHMRDPLSENLRSRLLIIPEIRAWTIQATPHNRAETGFTDDHQKVSISFPVNS
ncbi:MAG: hypothetical protein LBF16_13840 [Pseudomonadales bacterium]|jgi:hypothetical protein|nr:hypothetical protein [Pseudomonadales bacterium]